MTTFCATAAMSGGAQDMYRRNCSQVAGEVSMAPGSVSGGFKGIHRCGRYPVSIDLSAEWARRNLHFIRPSLATVHLQASSYVAPLYHSLLLLQSPSLRTYAAVAYKSPVATQ